MTLAEHGAPRRAGSVVLLVLSLALVGAVAALGTTAGTGGDWYDELDKAPWNPPGWVFGPAWTLLYVVMAVAAWLVARHGLERADVRGALGLYLAQLVLNAAWTPLFFGAQRPGWALLDILGLTGLVVVTIAAFRRVDAPAAWLLIPYLGWLVFAATLNLWIVLAN